jgi:hypothetical protein
MVNVGIYARDAVPPAIDGHWATKDVSFQEPDHASS